MFSPLQSPWVPAATFSDEGNLHLPLVGYLESGLFALSTAPNKMNQAEDTVYTAAKQCQCLTQRLPSVTFVVSLPEGMRATRFSTMKSLVKPSPSAGIGKEPFLPISPKAVQAATARSGLLLSRKEPRRNHKYKKWVTLQLVTECILKIWTGWLSFM